MAFTYYIKTYGCQMNAHESEKLSGILTSKGFEEASDEQQADIIVLNTCCIRESAETHVLGNLGIIKKYKEHNPNLKVAICGCMTQQRGVADRLKKRCPFIDLIFGTHNLHKFSEYVDRVFGGEKFTDIWEAEGSIEEGLPMKRTGTTSALVNIMYGCDNFCSYCIVPYVRGRERSRKPGNIIHDVENLVGQGYKEITLLGQNVNSYFCDGIDFATLLDKLSDIKGDYWIKFLTSHPKDLSEKVIEVIANKERLAHFIHLPIQSGSNRILELMNRKYTAEQYLQKIDMIKRYLPDAGLSCDIMVGFPTETEDDFLLTLDIVEKVRYTNLFSFIYSRRSGTPADKMEQVEEKTKKERIDRLIKKQFTIAQELANSNIGKIYKVLCDDICENKFIGKTQTDKKITFESDKARLGSFVNVKVTQATNSKLYGTEV